jgi:hypothetical protein
MVYFFPPHIYPDPRLRGRVFLIHFRANGSAGAHAIPSEEVASSCQSNFAAEYMLRRAFNSPEVIRQLPDRLKALSGKTVVMCDSKCFLISRALYFHRDQRRDSHNATLALRADATSISSCSRMVQAHQGIERIRDTNDLCLRWTRTGQG